MKLNAFSTYAFNANLRSITMRTQAELAVAQKEVVTGRVADIGNHLGARTALVVNVESEMQRLEQLTATNGALQSRMALMQSSMSSLSAAADHLTGHLTAEVGGSVDPDILSSLGRSLYGTMGEALNANMAGEYVFSGVNTDAVAFVQAGSSQSDVALQAVRDAFASHFGFAIDSAGAQSVTAAQMEIFINGPFATLFDDANWAALWTDASDRGTRARISPRELVEIPVTANAQAFRDLAAAATLVGELGGGNLNDGARGALAQKALELTATGLSRIGHEQSALGVVEARVSDASERIGLQNDLLARQQNELVGVDAYEAATRLNELMTGLEASYTVTARLQALSLMNYL